MQIEEWESLQRFLQVADSAGLRPIAWKYFYDFVVEAYKTPARPSVSEIANILHQYQLPHPGRLAVLYAHGLYILARFEGLEIFEGGFNP